VTNKSIFLRQTYYEDDVMGHT